MSANYPAGSPRGLVEVKERPTDRGRGSQESSAHASPINASSSSRPATPPMAAFVPAPEPPLPAIGSAARQPPTSCAPASAAPSSRTPHALFRAVQFSTNSLTGLLRRPGSAVASRNASPLAAAAPAAAPAQPVFELRGAALLPQGPRQDCGAGDPAGSLTDRSSAAAGKPAPQAYHLHARAVAPRPQQQQHQHQWRQEEPQRQPAVVAAHGLDLATPPAIAPIAGPAPTAAAPALTKAPAQQAAQAAEPPARPTSQISAQAGNPQQAPGHQRQQLPEPPAVQAQQRPAVPGSTAIASGAHGTHGSTRAQVSEPSAATSVHENPLYATGAEWACGTAQRQQYRQHSQFSLEAQGRPASLSAALATAPPAAVASATSAASGGSPQAHLQAASNLTLASDSRPISPGPFPSTVASTRTDSRPVSPQYIDSYPAVPAPPPLAQHALRVPALSPIRTTPPAPAVHAVQSRSLPASPSPLSAATPQSVPGGSPVAAVSGRLSGQAAAMAAFRVPIYNQEGRLVGYKQNSNLIPRPGTCVSSAPSSPCYPLAASTDAFSQDGAAGGGGASAGARRAPLPPPNSDDFREFACQPCKGFPDEENMIPGYVLGPLLGKGGFCSVRKVLHELTGQTMACKVIEKGKLKDPKDRDRVDRECRVMRNLSNHCGIIRLYEVVETRDHVYILMEAAARGSLLDYVRDRKKLPEDEAVQILQQLLHGLQYCHQHHVVHRDIKLENILMDGAGRMRLIDFGLCGYYVAGKKLRCHCGSPSYAAPEIVARKEYFGPPVDVWSLGIVLFAMLAGYLPFHAKEKKQLSEKILAGVYKPPSGMSPTAQDLLSRMLTLDPEQRITLEGIWAHPWVAAAPRWQPPGVGPTRLHRALTDPHTGAVVPDEAVLAQLEGMGADVVATRRSLRALETNSLTAAYHLLFESQMEARRQLVAMMAQEREMAAAAAAARRGPAAAAPGCPAASADWQWDFVAAGPTAGMPSSHGSAGSSSLRGSSSPVRPRTAGDAACGSPTRFGREAAVAAGYMSPSWRPPTATAGMPGVNGWSPFTSAYNLATGRAREAVPPTPAPVPAPGPSVAPAGLPRVQAAHREQDPAFVIKALHPAGSMASDAAAAAIAAAAAEFAGTAVAPAVVSSALLTAVSMAAGQADIMAAAAAELTSPALKSPRLTQLPTVASPKQLHLAGSADLSPAAALAQVAAA